MQIEQACRQIVASYGFLVDHRRYDEQAALFAPDGIYENPMTRIVGRSEIRSYLDKRPAKTATRHVCGQTFFEKVEADEVRCVTYVTVFMAPGSDEGPNDLTSGPSLCEFHNTLRRRNGDWEIAYHKSTGVMIAPR